MTEGVLGRQVLVQGELVGEHRVDEHHAGHLVGMVEEEGVRRQATEGRGHQDVGRLGATGPQDVLHVAQHVRGGLHRVHRLAAPDVAAVVEVVLAEEVTDLQGVQVRDVAVVDPAVQVHHGRAARPRAAHVELVAADVVEVPDLGPRVCRRVRGDARGRPGRRSYGRNAPARVGGLVHITCVAAPSDKRRAQQDPGEQPHGTAPHSRCHQSADLTLSRPGWPPTGLRRTARTGSVRSRRASASVMLRQSCDVPDHVVIVTSRRRSCPTNEVAAPTGCTKAQQRQCRSTRIRATTCEDSARHARTWQRRPALINAPSNHGADHRGKR